MSKEIIPFEINGVPWYISLLSNKDITKLYNQIFGTNFNFLYGFTLNTSSIIYINKDIDRHQQIHTLKHELTHCYIWQTGLYHIENYNEEQVCDLVAASNNFINRIVEDFKKGE